MVSFAGGAVAVAWDHPRGERIAQFLFGHVPADDGIAPCGNYRIGWIERAQTLALYRGDVLIYLGDSEGYLAELLMGEVCRLLATQSRGGMLYHAAGLARNGLGIMLPGAMTLGKSTLAAWLTTQGFDYLTDELVFIPHGADEMQPFIRPLNLRRPSRAALPDLDWPLLERCLLPSAESDLLPPDALNRSGRWETPPLRVIVFPSYAPDAAQAVRRLGQAEATMALLSCLVNSVSLPNRGVPEAARIVRRTPAYQARYAHLSQLTASLALWMQEI